MITHFYSDPHFGHKNILKHCPLRPFFSLEQMHEAFIRNYNAVTTESSVVCWVGDCFWYDGDFAKSIMDQLNGTKILTVGNHDKSKAKMLAMGFSIVADEFHILLGGKRCFVSHYPPLGARHPGYEYDDRYADKRPDRKSHEIIIHGHTHSSKRKDGNAIHVGVDAWDYAPVRVESIVELILKG